MATQQYIRQATNQIRRARFQIESALVGYLNECQLNGTGKSYPENNPEWLELYETAVALQASLTQIVTQVGHEFDREHIFKVEVTSYGQRLNGKQGITGVIVVNYHIKELPLLPRRFPSSAFKSLDDRQTELNKHITGE